MNRHVASFAVAALLTVSAASGPAAAPLPLGSVAPNFTKSALSGGSVSLSDYAGKVVVLFLLGCT